MAKITRGRKKGNKNRGYFYRKGRGWHVVDGRRLIPLRYENGESIRDRRAERDAREAYADFLRRSNAAQEAPTSEIPDVTLLDVCRLYLENAKATGAPKTHQDRAATLFDFCFGLRSEYRNYCTIDAFRDGDAPPKKFTSIVQAAAERERIHSGLGSKPSAELRKLDIDQWLNAHKRWSPSGRRSRIQAIKRAINYGVESGVIAKNPIRGYKLPKSKARVTHITPQQEEAIYRFASPALAMAVRVCIRTGARFGTEFVNLTARHVTDMGDRMEWKFPASEVKTRKDRIIRISDQEVIRLVRERMTKCPNDSPIFRTSKGDAWTKKNLSQRFRFLKRRLRREGIELDADACMYSCRHTYAKRTLQGYWTGRPTNIETLARLMGNSPQVCRAHYLQWSEVDNEHLWEVA